MRKKVLSASLVTIAYLCLTSSPIHAQYQPPGSDTVAKSTAVLNEFMAIPNQGIPRSMLKRAQGIVIVPNMIKVGFVVGGRRGKGIAVVRDANGVWRPPTFVTMTGGSVGFQAGVQSTDVVLIFNTRKSVDNLMSGKFTIGVDAAASAGPVGRQATAATDARLQAEIFSYSRSRGLFAGASVDGSVIQVNAAETQNFYSAAGLSADGTPVAPNAQMPLAAAQLIAALGTYTGAPVTAVAPATVPPAMPPVMTANPAAVPPAASPIAGSPMPGTIAPGNPAVGAINPAATPATGAVMPPNMGRSVAASPAAPAISPPASTPASGPRGTPSAQALEITRQELAKSAKNLGAILDDSWRTYLSLPENIYTGEGTPTKESLHQSLQRFDAIAKEGKYNTLLKRKEFQQTYSLLRTYTEQINVISTMPAQLPSASVTPGTGAIR